MFSAKGFAFRGSCLVCVSIWSVYANAGSASTTTTTLIVSSNTVAAGTVITLSASVAGNLAVNKGTVKFCNALAAYCDGAALLAIAQLTQAQIATVELRLGVGTYQIKAQFCGFANASRSFSAPQTVTVTGAANYPSATTLAKPSGTIGNNTFTATVHAFGRAASSSVVSFRDASNHNFPVASATLNPASQLFNYIPSPPITSEPAISYIAIGDFNNDGIPDLAILNRESAGTIGVLLGNGNGTFRSSVEYAAGQSAPMLLAADVNHDGNLDLIALNPTQGAVGVFLGNGDGSFQTPILTAVGNSPTFVAVGDFNQDGLLDLAVTNALAASVSILLGNGDGTFQSPVAYASGINPAGIAVGDFDDDGILDLAVGNAGDPSLSILLGNGDGTFQPKHTLGLPDNASPASLASGDLRNNGRSDLAVGDGNHADVIVLLSNGDGTFQSGITYNLPMPTLALSLADMNGDGILDLVAPNAAAGVVSVLLGSGDGTFAATHDYAAANRASFAATADFNGDGMLDIVTADTVSSTSTILLQVGTETTMPMADGVALVGAGAHNIFAIFPGDTERASSQSASRPVLGDSPASTKISLSATPNPAMVGHRVLLTAKVAPVPACSLPQAQGSPASGPSSPPIATCPLGSVSFYQGTARIGTAYVNASGIARTTSTNLPTGVFGVTGVYSGNGLFAGSTSSPVDETILPKISTRVTLTVSPNPVSAGESVTLKAAISPVPTGSSLGTITFLNGSAPLRNFTVDSAGAATFTTADLPGGKLSLTAGYSGNADLAGSESASLIETVNTAYTVEGPTTPVTISPGSVADIRVMVPAVGGAYKNPVAMSATGFPPGAWASFSPVNVTPGSAGSQSILSIQLPPLAAGILDANPEFPFRNLPLSFLVLCSGVVGISFRDRLSHIGKRFAAIALLSSLCWNLAACAGSSASPTTRLGSYAVTVTGTSGALHASTTFTVVVK